MFLKYSAIFAAAQAANWNYKTNNGEDWPSVVINNNKCGGTNQSPIDLKTEGWPKFDAERDNFQKMYSNTGATYATMNGHTSQVELTSA